MSDPADLQYTETHEWVRMEGSRVILGITDFAQSALGSVVHVEFPAVGASVTAGEPLGEIESTKSVSEIYAPATGTVSKVNGEVDDSPELVNDDPYGRGWLLEIDLGSGGEMRNLLSAAEYADVQAASKDH